MKIRILPPIKRYMNAIEFHLHLPSREKRRVMADLISTVAARHEAGEEYEAIMADMGTPRQVAESFNQELSAPLPRGSRLRFLFLGLLILFILGTALQMSYVNGLVHGLSQLVVGQEGFHSQPWSGQSGSIGIIGGADGPTAIFVAASVPPVLSGLFFSPLGIVLALSSAYWLAHLGKYGSSRQYAFGACLSGAGLAVFLWGYGWQMWDLFSLETLTLSGVLLPFLSPAFWLSLGCLFLSVRYRQAAHSL